MTDRNKMKKRKFYKNCMLFMLLRAFTINSLLTFYSMPMLKMSHARVPSPKHDCHTFQLCQHLNRFAKLYSKICQAFHRSVLIQTVFFTYSKPLCCVMLSLRPFSTLFKFVKALFWSAHNKKQDHLR